MSQKSTDSAKSFLIKELKDNPDHETNMYLNKGPDRLVDRDCHYLDGRCDCKSINDCKYLKRVK